ncbi:MAG: hypothetical protein WCS15_00115 [Prevotella sp.]
MKPCDRFSVPCADKKRYPWCQGPRYWEHRDLRDGERDTLLLSDMTECPWIEQVREWWKEYH